MKRHASSPQRRMAQTEAASAHDGGEFTFLELPVFNMDQGAQITRFLAGESCAPSDTVMRLVPSSPGGFYKDGVPVQPMSDAINLLVKATACGCLYWFKDQDTRWPFLDCGPEDIVWHQAPPNWQDRQSRGDWSTVPADRPEVAPWLREENEAA